MAKQNTINCDLPIFSYLKSSQDKQIRLTKHRFYTTHKIINHGKTNKTIQHSKNKKKKEKG